jgi:hypothetical protein
MDIGLMVQMSSFLLFFEKHTPTFIRRGEEKSGEPTSPSENLLL